MRFTIGAYQTVTAEVTETRDSFRSVITAIRPIPFTVFIYFAEWLVHPVPNAATLCHRIVFKYIPVFFQSAATVAHRMKIFAKNKRTVDVFLRKICFDVVHTAVHTAVNIRIIVQFGTFVLHRTSVFYRFQPVVGTLEVDSVAGFISQRPEGDARIVLVAFEHIDGTVHVWFQPFGVVTQWTALSKIVIHSVAFDIGFIVHIKTVFIAKFVETAVLRIVAKAYAVQVMLLHKLEVTTH